MCIRGAGLLITVSWLASNLLTKTEKRLRFNSSPLAAQESCSTGADSSLYSLAFAFPVDQVWKYSEFLP